MNRADDQPAEGLLIEQARERLGIRQNEAARRAGMSGTRWRQIVDRDAATMTSPRGVERLALMASVVRADSEGFAAIGRTDIADAIGSQQEATEAKMTAVERDLLARVVALEEEIRELRAERDGEPPRAENGRRRGR